MDDLISRQAAIDALLGITAMRNTIPLDSAIFNIKKLPSAQPADADCWGCNCQKMERSKEKKTFSEMVHLHDAETHEERTETHACDLISRQALMKEFSDFVRASNNSNFARTPTWNDAVSLVGSMPSAQPESARTFVELVVEYPDPELCTYKEYKGKPYYSIKYIENGETYVGYGTYNPEVLSQFLKEYFIPSAQPEIVRCGQCKYAEVADAQDNQDGYTCQFHRGSIWFSGSYCSWGKEKTDGRD